jgi:hypothetical protein
MLGGNFGDFNGAFDHRFHDLLDSFFEAGADKGFDVMDVKGLAEFEEFLIDN